MEKLETLCKKPNAIRLILLLDRERSQKEVLASRVISSGAYYGALKDLLALGLVERVKKQEGDEVVYYLRLTEKGQRVRKALTEIAEALK